MIPYSGIIFFMADLNNTLSEQSTQVEAPNTDIRSLVGSVDISTFDERLNPILNNPELKKKLIQSLRDNQPISGWLQFSKLIKWIEETQVATEKTQVATEKTQVATEKTQVATKETQAATKETQAEKRNKERLQSAEIATRGVTGAIKDIDNGITNPETRSKISTEINSELQDIKNGKASEETKSFLDSIGATTPESIGSPAIQNILSARIATWVYLRNQDIIQKENPKLAEQFGILETNKHALGYKSEFRADNTKNFITDFPKNDRESVISTVNSLTKWSPETPVTRTWDRLTFADPQNDRYAYEIDMAVRPPRLSKSLSGLSITRDITPLSREDAEWIEKKERAEKSLREGTDKRNNSLGEFYGVRREEYWLTNTKWEPTLYNAFRGENRENCRQYDMFEQPYAQGEFNDTDKMRALEQMISLTETMRSDNLQKLLNTGETENHGTINKMLEKRLSKLNTLISAEKQLASVDKKALKYKSTGWTTLEWQDNASESLRLLSSLGFAQLGQEWMTDIIDAWNEKNIGMKNYQIDLSSNPKLDDIQKKRFWEFMENRFWQTESTRNMNLTQLKDNLTKKTFTDQNWSNPEKKSAYLFDTSNTEISQPNSSTPNQNN